MAFIGGDGAFMFPHKHIALTLSCNILQYELCLHKIV